MYIELGSHSMFHVNIKVEVTDFTMLVVSGNRYKIDHGIPGTGLVMKIFEPQY